ncbi:hypothetical protein [Mesorhizobium sp. WSM3224]|uniref:hypothetical protein n=1 Tax=Mesorhizobium sp. WSM3224 TaxID=1040986 RepID=UPI00041A6710|nr:hypothetical protein [Mesorhizobium sp. WSM3224]
MRLVAALAALRSFDDKALLSYVLNQAAEYHLTCGELEPARLAADEAFAFAEV